MLITDGVEGDNMILESPKQRKTRVMKMLDPSESKKLSACVEAVVNHVHDSTICIPQGAAAKQATANNADLSDL